MTWAEVKTMLDEATPEQLAGPVRVLRWSEERADRAFDGGHEVPVMAFDKANKLHTTTRVYGPDELLLVVAD